MALTKALLSGVTASVTSSSGLQVTGKDRALFFRRPVLQMSYVMPLPHIRYTREMSLSVDDLSRNDERKKMRQRQYDQLSLRNPSRTPDYFPERSNSSHLHHVRNYPCSIAILILITFLV